MRCDSPPSGTKSELFVFMYASASSVRASSLPIPLHDAVSLSTSAAAVSTGTSDCSIASSTSSAVWTALGNVELYTLSNRTPSARSRLPSDFDWRTPVSVRGESWSVAPIHPSSTLDCDSPCRNTNSSQRKSL